MEFFGIASPIGSVAALNYGSVGCFLVLWHARHAVDFTATLSSRPLCRQDLTVLSKTHRRRRIVGETG
jgi:hypothetical protein